MAPSSRSFLYLASSSAADKEASGAFSSGLELEEVFCIAIALSILISFIASALFLKYNADESETGEIIKGIVITGSDILEV